MSNNIVAVAIHDLAKTSDGFQVRLGKPQLAITKTAQRVIDDLSNLYSRRASKSHGKFSTNEDYSPTQKHLREFVDGDLTEFGTLTANLMTTLQKQASFKGAATGGHVFFAHFERESRQFLLVAIITDKLGAALTRDFDVRDVEHLDMDGFRFAGRINVSGWAANEERYIGFLKGKGNVSDYFKEFLGCDTAIQDRQDTSDLVRTLKQFAEAQGMPRLDRDDFLSRAKAICDRSARARDEIDFQTLANELMPKSPAILLDALTDPELKLNDGFVPDRRALSSLVRFKARTPLWSVEFDREALSGGKILFDATDRTLTLTDLPEELTAQLKAEIEVDD